MRRTGKIRNPSGGTVDTTFTPAQAIRAFCAECRGWQGDPKDCTSVLCPVYQYRGKSFAYNGKRESTLTPEQRAAAGARLRAMSLAAQATRHEDD